MPAENSEVMQQDTSEKWSKLGRVIGIEVTLIAVISTFFLYGGQDLYVFYHPFASGCLVCGFVPYYAVWVLWPLRFITVPYLWPLWTAISAGGFLWISRYTRVNPAWLFLSFPFFGQLWLGQIDVVIAFGLAIALLASNSYLRGVGMALALVKPQLAVVALVYLVISEKPSERLKVLVAPGAMLVTSLLVFGLAWPVTWLVDTLNNIPRHIWQLASHDTWRLAFPLLGVPLLLVRRHDRFNASLLVSALATPFFSVYSYSLFLAFYNKWWALILSYIWVLAYPLLNKSAMRFAWVLPLGLLAHFLYDTREHNTGMAYLRAWRARRLTATGDELQG